MNKKTKISILGSTGSIGTQALNVISAFSEHFEVVALAAGKNTDLLTKQIVTFKPKAVCVEDKHHLDLLTAHSFSHNMDGYYGDTGLMNLVSYETDILLVATPGNLAIKAVEKSLDYTTKLALASKEILVVAGEFIMPLAKQKNVAILPVDSEHAAIYQLLNHSHKSELKKITLSASGGPFWKRKTLENISPKEALKHPNWTMGQKISIDSASMINKGFEIIETHHLFGIDYHQIDAIIHPESIIHAFVEHIDGSFFAHLGPTDMRYPIQYCLMQTKRHPKTWQPFSLKDLSSLHFHEIDTNKFPLFKLACDTAKEGSAATCVLSSANDMAVSYFLEGKLDFLDMFSFVSEAINHYASCQIKSLDDLLNLDQHVRYELSKK